MFQIAKCCKVNFSKQSQATVNCKHWHRFVYTVGTSHNYQCLSLLNLSNQNSKRFIVYKDNVNIGSHIHLLHTMTILGYTYIYFTQCQYWATHTFTSHNVNIGPHIHLLHTMSILGHTYIYFTQCQYWATHTFTSHNVNIGPHIHLLHTMSMD